MVGVEVLEHRVIKGSQFSRSFGVRNTEVKVDEVEPLKGRAKFGTREHAVGIDVKFMEQGIHS